MVMALGRRVFDNVEAWYIVVGALLGETVEQVVVVGEKYIMLWGGQIQGKGVRA